MEDVRRIAAEPYVCADELETLNAVKVFKRVLYIFTKFVPNLLIACGLQLYAVLECLYQLIVPKTLTNVRGQLAVVTGGGNGIGREICLQLAKHGCNVAVLDMDMDGAERTCSDIRQFDVTAKPYKIDVGDYAQVVAVKKLIDLDMGAVDILVNNAGLMPKLSLRDGTPDEIERIINVNIVSHFWMVRVFIEDMIARGCGHIVAIASLIAFYPSNRAIAYSTTKCAVKGFMEALDQEIRVDRLPIKTTTVFPYFTNTRKEVIDYVHTILSPTALESFGFCTPAEVAEATVAAIRDGSKSVSVPWYLLGGGKLFAALPTSWQAIVSAKILPHALPSEKTVSGSNAKRQKTM